MNSNGKQKVRFRDIANLRQVIGEYMVELGRRNDKIVIVNSDSRVGGRNTSFAEIFPNREFNVGIAEQNMLGCAAGLAHEGFIPFTFSFSPFITMRACEQARTDIAYSNSRVRMCGSYGGYSGGISGATHWGLEDIAIMTAIDGMMVIELSDPYQAITVLDKSLVHDGPMYIRVGVAPIKVIYDENYKLDLGKATITRDGNDGAFIVSGPIVQYAIEAAERIKDKTGMRIRVVDMHTIKPIDKEAVLKASYTKNVIVAQDHNKIGGLGYMVAAVLAENGKTCNFKILGCSDDFIPMAHAPYLYHKYEYDADGLEKNMLDMIGKGDTK